MLFSTAWDATVPIAMINNTAMLICLDGFMVFVWTGLMQILWVYDNSQVKWLAANDEKNTMT
ncbi:MAG: hypothetical protein HKP20_06505 [Akkermansiaceae bacterium]|nr:hypothetical protein [Akkermansiaceae bacterium]